MDPIKLSAFPVVAANGKATLNLNELAGYSVHALTLVQSGGSFLKSHVDGIKFSVGSKALIQDISGTNLQLLNTYESLPDETNLIDLFFGDPTANTAYGQHLTDLDLSFYSGTPTLEIDIGAATTPGLEAWAHVGPPKHQMGLGYTAAEVALTRALIRTVIQPSAAVTKKSYQVGLGSEAGAHLRRLAFFHANLTSMEFKKGGVVRHDDLNIILNAHIQKIYARAPQANLYVLDRIVDGYQGKAENTVQENGKPWPMQVNLSTSAGDTIDCYADIRASINLL